MMATQVTQPELDIISVLPGHIKDDILSCLPLRDAIRTSVLSKKWKNQWRTIRELVFDTDNVFSEPPQNPVMVEMKFYHIIYHVLLNHSGPIDLFSFLDSTGDMNVRSHGTEFDSWLLYLSKRNVQSLVLDFSKEETYSIPWCLFTFQHLRHLDLSCCSLKPPPTFGGMCNLKTLKLTKVNMSQVDLENVIRICPELEYLTLVGIEGFSRININAPSLKSFAILGPAVEFNLQYKFQLTHLSMLFSTEINRYPPSSNLTTVFGGLPLLKKLFLSRKVLKYFTAGAGVVPVNLPTPLNNLGYLYLSIKFSNKMELSASLCLLRSSPNLQRFEITVEREEPLARDFYSWEDITSGPQMPLNLRYVVIDGINAVKSELDLIKFILMNSPFLIEMILKPGVKYNPKLMRELMTYYRASDIVEINCEGEEF